MSHQNQEFRKNAGNEAMVLGSSKEIMSNGKLENAIVISPSSDIDTPVIEGKGPRNAYFCTYSMVCRRQNKNPEKYLVN